MKAVSKSDLNLFSAKLKALLKSRKIKASDLDSGSATAGQVFTADGSGGGSYQTPQTGTTVVANPTLAGTEADLTGLQVGETKYKVPSGGSNHLYWHSCYFYYDTQGTITPSVNALGFVVVLSTSATALTKSTFFDLVNGGGDFLIVAGKLTYGGTGSVGTPLWFGRKNPVSSASINLTYADVDGNLQSTTVATTTMTGLTDTVTQIF